MSSGIRNWALVALVGGLAACSGSDGPSTEAATPPDDAKPVRTVTFDPTRCTLQAGAPYGQAVGITGTNMMVTSADVNASAAGCKVLASGGSAVDAAIAVQAVLGVTEPFGSGLAGGSVITYYDAASNKVRTFDGFSAAPATTGGVDTIYKAVAQDVSTTPPYNRCRSTVTTVGSSLAAWQGHTNISARAVAIPGTVKVLDLVHQQFGRKAWNQLWDDAIALADNGFPMTRYMYSTLYSDAAGTDDDGNPIVPGGVKSWVNSAGTSWGPPRCMYADIKARYCDATDAAQERPLAVGTTIRNPELAATMRLVRDGGAAAFYDPAGPIAQAVVSKLTTNQLPCDSLISTGTPRAAKIPSLMTAADFGTYRAVERRPLVGQRFGMTIYTQPAPSFGGVVTLYTLGLLERKGLPVATDTAAMAHLATEASRLANADRRNIVGDPAWSNTNARISVLLSSPYLDARAGLITGTALGTAPAGGVAEGIPAFAATDPAGYDTMAARSLRRPAPQSQLARGTARNEDWNTTSNLAVIDGYGNALAMTTTINTHWGAHIEAAGMMINNAMSNFSAGTPGLDVNGYAAHKRPRSSIAPAIAFDADGRVRLVWGSAGGGPIPDYIVKTFIGWRAGLDLQQAINADNWTGQNGIAELESGKPIAALVPTLIGTYGNTAANAQATGLKSGISGIAVHYDANGFPVYTGAADYRRHGGAVGY